mmetsp:Transcript_12841/g.29119  ORF Transcript_12841/g.29119 Transcript_12841/m.29119 type:complete len:209 (-) Transcript_12841:943-1569(-)
MLRVLRSAASASWRIFQKVWTAPWRRTRPSLAVRGRRPPWRKSSCASRSPRSETCSRLASKTWTFAPALSTRSCRTPACVSSGTCSAPQSSCTRSGWRSTARCTATPLSWNPSERGRTTGPRSTSAGTSRRNCPTCCRRPPSWRLSQAEMGTQWLSSRWSRPPSTRAHRLPSLASGPSRTRGWGTCTRSPTAGQEQLSTPCPRPLQGR